MLELHSELKSLSTTLNGNVIHVNNQMKIWTYKNINVLYRCNGIVLSPPSGCYYSDFYLAVYKTKFGINLDFEPLFEETVVDTEEEVNVTLIKDNSGIEICYLENYDNSKPIDLILNF